MGVDFIEFPKLGIKLNLSPVAFSIPGTNIEVRWYGIIISAAILVALTLALKQSKKFDIKEDDVIDLFLVALPAAIIFGRLFFVAFTWKDYKYDLLNIFKIWEGGISIFGVLIGAFLSAYIFCRMKKLDFLYFLDFGCVYLPLAQAIGRWGNFTNQELYGTNTDLPWGMTGNRIQAFPDPGVDGTKLVHPTFLYESILNIIVFVVLLRLRKKHKVKGSVLASYLMMYSFVRFMMEFIRVDQFGTGSIRYNQVVAALIFIAAAVWLVWVVKRPVKLADTDEEIAPSAYASILEEIRSEEQENTQEQENLTQEEDQSQENSNPDQQEVKADRDLMTEDDNLKNGQQGDNDTETDQKHEN